MKHTKGPWRIGIKHPGRVIGEARVVAYCIQPEFEDDIKYGDWDEEKANARLVAAAPELLEACKLALEVDLALPDLDQHPGMQGKLQEAIARAEGK